jgi:hypothetical protein
MTVDTENHRFPVDDKLLLPDPLRRLNDPGISGGPIITIACEQPHAVVVTNDDDPITVILDFMYPVWTGWDLRPASRDTGLELS